MNIPKISFSSVKSKVTTMAKDSKEFVSKGFKSTKKLAVDTVTLAKASPAKAAVIGGAAVAGVAVVAASVALIKAGIEKAKIQKELESFRSNYN